MMDWQETKKHMEDRTRRRNEAIADLIKSHGDDDFTDFIPAYANLIDAVLSTDAGEIPVLVEYVERFTRDYPDDKERLIVNLRSTLAALLSA